MEKNREEFGDNKQTKIKFNFFVSIIKNYLSIFNIILLVIYAFNVYQYFQSPDIIDLISIIIIFTMIILSGSIGFFHEYNNYVITKSIFAKNKRFVKVIRNTDIDFYDISEENINQISKQTEIIDADELVIGDFVYITTGDVIEGDLKIIFENNFSVIQPSLSGEVFPVDKSIYNNNENMIDYENICYAGTTAATGYAIAVVIGTGKSTYQLKITNRIKDKPKKRLFDKYLFKISCFIVSFIALITPIVFGITKIEGNTWDYSLLYAVSLAVGLTPEMLPIIVALNLKNGFKILTKKYNFNIKTISSIQALGAIDVLCMDKTGTITEGEISLWKSCDYYGNRNDNLNVYSFINSNYQSGFKNHIDNAIIKKLDIYEPKVNEVKIIKEKPFDFNRKLLSLLVEYKDKKIQITKGASDEILGIVDKIELNGSVEKIQDKHIKKIEEDIINFNRSGYRIVCVATKSDNNNIEESNLTFLGFLIFFDKPKKETKKFIQQLGQRQIDYKILTGDSEVITKEIAKMSDIKIRGSISGVTLDKMTDEQFKNAVINNNIFYKLNPLLKSKILTTLQECGKVVGFIGDGINDVAVLRSSDVGISFRDASGPAQNAADIVIGGNELVDIDESVIRGREALCNIVKYINITIASNFGNTISILIAILWLKFTPMQPIQILTQNLLYDLTQFALIYDRVDSSFTKVPRSIDLKHIIRFSLISGPVSSIFDIICFLILTYVYKYTLNTPNQDQNIVLFNSSWFIVGLLTQAGVVFIFRTEYNNLFKTKPCSALVISNIFVFALGFIIPFTPGVSGLFSMAPPSYTFIFFALGIIIFYILLSMLVKYIYIKVFGSVW